MRHALVMGHCAARRETCNHAIDMHVEELHLEVHLDCGLIDRLRHLK